MGFRSHPCNAEVIDALLAALGAEPGSGRIHASASAHINQIRDPFDTTWTIQAMDNLIRQMNQGGFRHVVARVMGQQSHCPSAQMVSFRLEPLTKG